MCWIKEVEMDDLKTSRSIFGNQFPNFDMLDAKGRIGSKENAINGKRVDSATKGNACSFCHDENKRGEAMQSSSLAPEPQTESDRKISSKGKPLGGPSPSGKRSRRPCKDYISGKCTTIPSCDSWHPLVSELQNRIGMQGR